MIDLNAYRIRIGTYNVRFKSRLAKFSKHSILYFNLQHYLNIFMKIILVMLLVYTALQVFKVGCYFSAESPSLKLTERMVEYIPLVYRILGKKLSVNFLARYLNGNGNKPNRGLKNLHVNIRSLKNKISEVKMIVKEHHPHLIGLSECELYKFGNNYDVEHLKLPGYELLFPKSWDKFGFARVVLYVKKTLEFKQVFDIEDDRIQSIWVQAGFKNSRKIYYCHNYREHTSSLGSSLACQKQYLEKFLLQWELASTHGSRSEPNELHIVGDMNLDALNEKWLQPNYHLAALSKLVQLTCHSLNLSQIVSSATRHQFHSTSADTLISCLDHVYTNASFRCSEVKIIPFGSSDHEIIGYTRFMKEPPCPARTIRKRSYKNFVPEAFCNDLRKINWVEVTSCQDLDIATDIFTHIFQSVLSKHAPWVIFQQRKFFAPWITKETLALMRERDEAKKIAISLVHEGKDASEAWLNFKRLRNTINNRRKSEEIKYKTKCINQTLSSPSDTWKTAKQFMGWCNKSGPPTQLNSEGRLIKKAADIASEMNHFFMDKIRRIQESIAYVPNSFDACKNLMARKNCTLSLQHVTLSKVNRLLKTLKTNKSCSIDQLDNYSVKIAADIIDKPIHHIVTLSVLQQRFPSTWKLSKIIPLHKKGCHLDRQNYRPVAILSPVSKILERIIYDQVYSYFPKICFFTTVCMVTEDTGQHRLLSCPCLIDWSPQLQKEN